MTKRFTCGLAGGVFAATLMVLPGVVAAKGAKTTACEGLSGRPLATCVKYCEKLKCWEAADPKCTDLLEQFERETGNAIIPCAACGDGRCDFGETQCACPDDCTGIQPCG